MTGQKRRILVTGSSGWIGSAVSERMAPDAQIIGLDLVPGRWTSNVGDIADAKVVADAMRGVDVVVHVAGLHAPHVHSRSESEFRRTNVEATKILLDAALREKVQRFVLTSTTSVYGCTSRAKGEAVWVTEELEPRPEDIYDVTKLEAERFCLEASRAGLEVVVLRLSRCFPEPAPLMAFYRLYRGIDRRDAAEGHWLAATKPLTSFEIMNLSVEPVFRQEDIGLLWEEPWPVIDRRAPEVRDSFLLRGWPMPRLIDRVYSVEKAKRVLGYRSRYGFRAILKETAPLP